MAKSDCMLAIVWLLRSRGRMTAKELAETLEISVRSVYRYVDSLCASGVPIEAESGHDGGYRLPLSHGEVPLLFTTEERTALAHSALFAQKAGYPYTSALVDALRKIEYQSSEVQLRDLSLRAEGLHVVASRDHSAYQGVLVDLEKAIAHQQTSSITYRKAKAEVDASRQIDPYGLVHWRDRWYVVAHCHLRQEVRTFRVDRIGQCEATKKNFERPEGFSASDFFSSRQMTSTTSTDKLQRLLVRGDTDSIDDLTRQWFIGQRLVSKSSHEALFLIEEERLFSYVPHIILPFGRSLWIAEPESLNVRMAELASQLLAYYQDVHVH